MSSKLIVNKIDGDLVLSKEIFLKTNLEDEMQELGFVGEEIFPEISTCQEIWNIGYVEPIKRDSGKLLINITTDENALVLNIDKCIKTIKKHKNEKKQNQGKTFL